MEIFVFFVDILYILNIIKSKFLKSYGFKGFTKYAFHFFEKRVLKTLKQERRKL